MASRIDRDFKELTNAIERLLAREVAPVAPIAPIAPVLPIAPLLQTNTGDHDLLLRLEENVTLNFKQVKDAIRELSDGVNLQIADLQKRVGSLETAKTTTTIMLSVGLGWLTILTTAFIYYTTHK